MPEPIDNDFWAARWAEGKIGFHEGRPNAMLERHVDRLGAGRRVLVPLCGKAVDLAYLAARGHTVIGVELVEDAVRAFFAEHQLTPAVAARGKLTAYRAGAITLLAGDVFDATDDVLGPIDALYDRAALIALPADVRPRYVAHLRGLLPAGATGLLISIEYPEHQLSGPPFSVPEAEVRHLFDGLTVELLDSAPVRTGRLAEQGVTATEMCFRIAVP
jgi:thiopurine S-methyltransferase